MSVPDPNSAVKSLSWSSFGLTDTGKVRKHNEDGLLDRPEIGLWVVADGMGGHAAGDVASRLVVEAFEGLRAPLSLDEFAFAARERLHAANARVREQAQTAGIDGPMGSTVVAFLAHESRFVCFWAGDCRAYLLRDGWLSQVTRDHSVVEEMIDRGELARDEAASHPAANFVTRAVGADEALTVEERSAELREGDKILLCSDGLNKEVSDAEIAAILARHDCTRASRALIDLALERGARDNVTVAVITVYDEDDTAPTEWAERGRRGA